MNTELAEVRDQLNALHQKVDQLFDMISAFRNQQERTASMMEYLRHSIIAHQAFIDDRLGCFGESRIADPEEDAPDTDGIV